MTQHKEQRVLVLFDVQNLYYSAKHLYNTKVNFKAILAKAVAKRKLVRAIAYVIKTEIKEESSFHEALEKIGIEVKAKDIQIFYGGAKKGDWDIGIAMDSVRIAPKVDVVVLVSGDGDFKDLVLYLQGHGVRVESISFGETTSSRLKEVVDSFFDLSKSKNLFLLGSGPKKHAKPPVNQGKPQAAKAKPRPPAKSAPASKPKPAKPKPAAKPPVIQKAPKSDDDAYFIDT